MGMALAIIRDFLKTPPTRRYLDLEKTTKTSPTLFGAPVMEVDMVNLLVNLHQNHPQ